MTNNDNNNEEDDSTSSSEDDDDDDIDVYNNDIVGAGDIEGNSSRNNRRRRPRERRGFDRLRAVSLYFCILMQSIIGAKQLDYFLIYVLNQNTTQTDWYDTGGGCHDTSILCTIRESIYRSTSDYTHWFTSFT